MLPLTQRGSGPADDVPARGGGQHIPRPPSAQPGADAPWSDLDPDRPLPTIDDVRRGMAAAGPPRRSAVEALRPRAAAVLVPLYDHDGEAWVVLTRRAGHLRTHGGEVSFPGGGQDPADPDLAVTALREAWEEIGLDPASVDIIGQLDHLSTVTSRSFIVPYVGVLPARPDLTPNPAEVDVILHVPLSELLAPGVFREERWNLGPVARPIVFFELVGDTVWGATASLLRQLLGLVTATIGRGDLDHE
ncbi:MAG: CoA pyrophosphatase [Acidimicrobiales bacterium]